MSKLIVIQHIEREGPGLFSKLAIEKGMSISIHRIDQGEEVPNPEKGDLLLILGGPMSVNDMNKPNFKWITKEIELIRHTIKNEIALIGVCLGAQLIAHALGGTIKPILFGDPPTKLAEIGWGKIKRSNTSLNKQFKSLDASNLYVLHWHGERVILPPCIDLIASSDRCKEQFFKLGNYTYGLQFHIETEPKDVYRWVKEDKRFIDDALGVHGQSIVLSQQKSYGDKSRRHRIDLLSEIFNSLFS